MAQNSTKKVTSSWVELTDADVVNITLQNVDIEHLLVKGTVGAVEPTDDNGSMVFRPGQGVLNETLADLFPGILGVNRVFARAKSPAGEIMVSHA